MKKTFLARACLVAVFSIILGGSSAHAAGEYKARGFTLPSGAVKIDDDRYRLPMGWEDMLRFYRGAYPPARYTRHTLRNQSGVRAFHIVNPRSADDWTGVNIYEAARGEVRVYVLGKGGVEEQDDDGK